MTSKVLETEHSSFFAQIMNLPNDRFCKYSKTVFSAYFPCNYICRSTITKCHPYLLRMLLAIENLCARNHISPTYINVKPKSPKTARTRNDISCKIQFILIDEFLQFFLKQESYTKFTLSLQSGRHGAIFIPYERNFLCKI